MKNQLAFFVLSLSFFTCTTTNTTESPLPDSSKLDSLEQPNILFIMTDDHSRAAISSYGSKLIETPNIDLLAENGVRFTNCAVTNSICGPSRAVAMTGKHSHINGFKDNRSSFNGSQQTYPKLLQKAGYETMMIGKWHLRTTPQGFDYWNVLIGQGDYYKPKMIENGDTIEYPGYVTDIITDLALDQLKKRNKDKPFCMLYQQKAPHRNWMPDVKHLSDGEKNDYPVPDNFFDNYDNRTRAAAEQDLSVKDMYMSFDMKLDPSSFADSSETGSGGSKDYDAINSWKNVYDRMSPEEKSQWDAYYLPLSKQFYASTMSEREMALWKYQRYMNDYLKCIKSVDENLGRVIHYLKETGEWDNTLIVYTSDQGFFLGEHGWYDKRFMYEESLLTPCIMKLPNSTKASVNTDLAMNLDFAPTLLDYAGVAIPSDMQGKSLKLSIEGKGLDRQGQYYHYYEFPYGWHLVKKHYGVRTKNFKLIHFYQDTDEWELYDLKNDPHEMNNLYGNVEFQETQAELHQLLEELREEYKEEQL